MKKQIIIFAISAAILFGLPGRPAAITLDEALEIGAARSLKLESPRLDLLKVEGQIEEAWSNALPQADALVSYQRTIDAPVMFFPDGDGGIAKIQTQRSNAGYAEASVTQPIYTFGRVAAGLRAAYSARKATEHLQLSTGRAVQLEILQGFWTTLLLKDMLTVRKEALAFAESSLDRVIKLQEVGLLSEFDVLRARTQVSSLVPSLHQAENDLQLAELALKNNLGVPLDTLLTFEGSLDEFDVALNVDTSTSAALNRDDLEALRDLAHTMENGYVIYKNAGWPTLGAQGKYSWQWSSDRWVFDQFNHTSSLTAGLALSIPIWSSGRNSGKAQQMMADWRKAQLDLRNAERGVMLQVTQARNAYSTARLSEEAATIAVRQAVEAANLARARLANGQITQLEIQAAQLEETSAKLALLNARYTRLLAAAQLRLAAGHFPYKSVQ